MRCMHDSYISGTYNRMELPISRPRFRTLIRNKNSSHSIYLLLSIRNPDRYFDGVVPVASRKQRRKEVMLPNPER